MTRSVIAVRKNASFKELAVKLRDERISAFPVIDEGNRVIGVVSEGDLIAKEATAGGYEDLTGPPALPAAPPRAGKGQGPHRG